MSAQNDEDVRARIPEGTCGVCGAAPRDVAGSGKLVSIEDIDRAWLDELPPFCDTGVVARCFGISNSQARRWMKGGEAILPSARRPDGRWVTARGHVVKLAQKMYGEMGT